MSTSMNGLQIRSGTDSVLAVNFRTVSLNDKLVKKQILTLAVVYLFKDSVREFLSNCFLSYYLIQKQYQNC